MSLTPERLEELERLEKAATPVYGTASYTIERDVPIVIVWHRDELGRDVAHFLGNGRKATADAYIALRNAAPALISAARENAAKDAEIARLRRQLGHAEKEAEGYSDLHAEITRLRGAIQAELDRHDREDSVSDAQHDALRAALGKETKVTPDTPTVIRQVMYTDYIPLGTRQMICNEITALRKQLAEARSFAEVAAEKYNALIASPVLTCAFCGHQFPAGTPPTQHEALTAHVNVCEKHPLRQALAVAVAAFKGWESLPSSVLTAAIFDDTPQAQALSKARNEFYANPVLAGLMKGDESK